MDNLNVEILMSNSPVNKYVGEFMSLFKKDKEITVYYDSTYYANNNIHRINIYITNLEKYKVLKYLLKENFQLNNNELLIINPIFLNQEQEAELVTDEVDNYDPQYLFETAFKNNPAFSYCYEDGEDNDRVVYVIFQNKVVQYYNSNIEDIYGNTNTLYQEIAKDVFKIQNIYYCTDLSQENLKTH